MPSIDLPAWLAFALARLVESIPVLLGGAGGVFLVWWLDGRRERARELRSLRGAALVVTFELSSNAAQANEWARLAAERPAAESATAPPIDMRFDAWERNQNELARSMSRMELTQLGVAYSLARLFLPSIEASRRNHSISREDIKLATRVRDTFTVALRVLQEYERTRLGVRHQAEAGPAEERASRGADSE